MVTYPPACQMVHYGVHFFLLRHSTLLVNGHNQLHSRRRIRCVSVLLARTELMNTAMQDTFYLSSWQVFFICILLFPGLSNVTDCILRYRLKMEGAGRVALQQLKWIRTSTFIARALIKTDIFKLFSQSSFPGSHSKSHTRCSPIYFRSMSVGLRLLRKFINRISSVRSL